MQSMMLVWQTNVRVECSPSHLISLRLRCLIVRPCSSSPSSFSLHSSHAEDGVDGHVVRAAGVALLQHALHHAHLRLAQRALRVAGRSARRVGGVGKDGGEGRRADDESGAGAVGGLPSGGRSRGPMYLNSAMVG